jgi:hypothetical protein
MSNPPIFAPFTRAFIILIGVQILSNFLGAQSLEIQIIDSKHNKILPSGSGMALLQDRIFVVGDDTPFLFELDSTFNVVNKWEIAPYDTLVDNRLPKKTKPDYEAMEALGDSALLIFASGSSPTLRDWVVLVQFVDNLPVFKKAMTTPFFASLKNHPSMMGAELNLEAVVILGDDVLLFNRGQHLIFKCNLNALLSHFYENLPIPKVTVFTFSLPEISGVQSGFSGATLSPDNAYILVTTSVEATKNAYDDGRVLGSFIGIIPVEDGKLQESIFAIQQLPNTAQKLESIVVIRQSNTHDFLVYLVADNDDGTSVFTKATLKLLLDGLSRPKGQ